MTPESTNWCVEKWNWEDKASSRSVSMFLLGNKLNTIEMPRRWRGRKRIYFLLIGWGLFPRLSFSCPVYELSILQLLDMALGVGIKKMLAGAETVNTKYLKQFHMFMIVCIRSSYFLCNKKDKATHGLFEIFYNFKNTEAARLIRSSSEGWW